MIAVMVVKIGVLAMNATRPKPAAGTVIAVRFAVASVAEIPLATTTSLPVVPCVRVGVHGVAGAATASTTVSGHTPRPHAPAAKVVVD